MYINFKILVSSNANFKKTYDPRPLELHEGSWFLNVNIWLKVWYCYPLCFENLVIPMFERCNFKLLKFDGKLFICKFLSSLSSIFKQVKYYCCTRVISHHNLSDKEIVFEVILRRKNMLIFGVSLKSHIFYAVLWRAACI